MPDVRPRPAVAWGAASRPHPGHRVTGDLTVVTSMEAGTLVAAVDGAGHGSEAVRAAECARGVLEAFAGPDVAGVVTRCHEALRSTRGAAMSLAFVSTAAGVLTWLSVGNVMGTLVTGDGLGPRRQTWLATPGGVAGHQLPALHPRQLPLRRGDVLVLATDGVDAGFADALELSGSPEAIAERLMERHWTGRDDAAAIVVRHLGAAP